MGENCPTCSGHPRFTVGMVCQTCGKDYGPTQCEATSYQGKTKKNKPYGIGGYNQCTKEQGHDGPHTDQFGERWVSPTPSPARDDAEKIAALRADLEVQQKQNKELADERDALRERIRALADEWQGELDSGAIRDENARYCWGIAVREVRTALGDA